MIVFPLCQLSTAGKYFFVFYGVTMTYAEKLKDPRWQKKRLEIMQRDEFMCRVCQDDESTLNVHHYYYKSGIEPWEYDNNDLITLCESCHNAEKDERKEYEKTIIEILKYRGVLANEVQDLMIILNTTPLKLHCELDISALKWWLRSEENINFMINKFLDYLKEKNLKGIL
jgi:hypothetical protein